LLFGDGSLVQTSGRELRWILRSGCGTAESGSSKAYLLAQLFLRSSFFAADFAYCSSVFLASPLETGKDHRFLNQWAFTVQHVGFIVIKKPAKKKSPQVNHDLWALKFYWAVFSAFASASGSGQT
jgi:hypothetical protein